MSDWWCSCQPTSHAAVREGIAELPYLRYTLSRKQPRCLLTPPPSVNVCTHAGCCCLAGCWLWVFRGEAGYQVGICGGLQHFIAQLLQQLCSICCLSPNPSPASKGGGSKVHLQCLLAYGPVRRHQCISRAWAVRPGTMLFTSNNLRGSCIRACPSVTSSVCVLCVQGSCAVDLPVRSSPPGQPSATCRLVRWAS